MVVAGAQQFDLRQFEGSTWKESHSRVRFYTGVTFSLLWPSLIVLVVLLNRQTPFTIQGALIAAVVSGLIEWLTITFALSFSHGPIGATLSPRVFTLYFLGQRVRTYNFDSPGLKLELRFDEDPKLGALQYSIVGRRPTRSFIPVDLYRAVVDVATHSNCRVTRTKTWYGENVLRLRGPA